MRNRILLFGVLTVVSLCVVSQGCNNGEGAKSEGDKNGPKASASGKKTGASGKKTSAGGTKKPTEDPDENPEKATGNGAVVINVPDVPKGDGLLTPDPLDPETPPVVPTVEMTEEHAATCLVKVGDKLPTDQLPDLAGQPQDLARLFGDTLTVVVFFRAGEDASLTELSDLEVGVAGPLSTRGVKVIGVCERGDVAAIDATCKKAGVSFPILLDTGGAYFTKNLATGKMPRTYLLDNTGTILWLDIDYTRDTRHDLREALRALVKK